jgi:purine-cytosine permease-like protein
VLLVGAVYLAAGIGFGALAAGSASQQIRVTWRLAAWLASAAAFAAHIGYEHFRRRNPPRATAWHTPLAFALGAFALAAVGLARTRPSS